VIAADVAAGAGDPACLPEAPHPRARPIRMQSETRCTSVSFKEASRGKFDGSYAGLNLRVSGM
jgi:hypothetical protein